MQKIVSVALKFYFPTGARFPGVLGSWGTKSPLRKFSGIALKSERLLHTGICPLALHSHSIFCLNP